MSVEFGRRSLKESQLRKRGTPQASSSKRPRLLAER